MLTCVREVGNDLLTGHETVDRERRQHRRLAIRLPLECYPADAGRDHALRTVTANISTGGLYFEIDRMEGVSVPEPNRRLHVELTVPPGDGHFPYQGRVSSVAEVARREDIPPPSPADTAHPARVGLAAKFLEPLRLAF